VINHMQKHLPKDEIFVFSLCERPCEQHIVPQPRQIIAHLPLNPVPVGADSLPVLKLSGIERLWELGAAQWAEPGVINAHEMDDLVAHRTMRVAYLLREQFLGERRDILISNIAIFGEVIFVKMSKCIRIHIVVCSSNCDEPDYSTSVRINPKFVLFIRYGRFLEENTRPGK
jgi:hypothetical protein